MKTIIKSLAIMAGMMVCTSAIAQDTFKVKVDQPDMEK